MFRQLAHEEWVLPSHYVGAHTVRKLYKIPSWTGASFSNIPIKVQIHRYRCLKLDILGFMFRQSANEEWVLPSLNVWPHSLRNYTIFQVWLAIHLAIFLSKYKILRYMWSKDDKLRCMFRQTAHEARPLRSHNVGANNPKTKIQNSKLDWRSHYQYSNECSYTTIQTVERWQIALYVSKTAHETWILKRHNVRAHSLRNYTIFQFGLQIQLAIISTQKPNTKTHMTYSRLIALCVLINGSRSMDFTKSCRSSSYPKKIANFQVALLIQQTIFHTKSKY